MAKAKKQSTQHGTPVTVKEKATIKRMVKEGTATVQIAKEVGRSVQALRKIAFRSGISLRKKAAKVAKKVKKAVKKMAKKKAK